MSSAAFTSSPSLLSLCGDSPSIDSLGTNDTELDTDEAIVETSRTRRTSALAEVWVGAGTETWAGVLLLKDRVSELGTGHSYRIHLGPARDFL